MKAIQIESLTKKFGDFTAVNNLSLSVNKSEIVGFLGPNGSGKSTTLRCMLGLISPTSYSRLEFFGYDTIKQRKQAISKVGCLIEKPDFYKYLNGRQNLNILSNYYAEKISKSHIDYLIELVGLQHKINNRVGTYSHGMKQRLGLAVALLNKPDLLILDEPNTGLDPEGIVELRNLIVKLKNEGKTILLSSHILSEIEQIADAVIIIHNGQKVLDERLKNLNSGEQLTLTVETINRPDFHSILKTFSSISNMDTINEKKVKVRISSDSINLFIQHLIMNGVLIQNINSRNRLEEEFTNITNA